MSRQLTASVVVLSICTLLIGGHTRGQQRITIADAESKWSDYWVETKVIDGGEKADSSALMCYSFKLDPVDKMYAAWQRYGESVLAKHNNSLKFDTSKDPMQVDYITLVGIIPGIFKFEDDSLVWVTPREYGAVRQGPFEKPLKRPTDFTSTKENGHVVRTLKRTNGLYGTEPLKK